VPERRGFEWDDAKASNFAKHGISFAYAARVFLDSALVDLEASWADQAEVRRKAVGVIEGRVFTVVYTTRGAVIRIISARRCNSKEARAYGQVRA
jgi:uncharacterized protein